MNAMKKILVTATVMLLIFFAVVYTSCRRDPCTKMVCYNGGVCSRGTCLCPTGFTGSLCQYTSIVYYNNTYTPVYITVNGSQATIPAGESVVFDGTPGDYADVYAYTMGQTSSGTQIGLKISWDFSENFPISGVYETDINVSAKYFFLQLKNSSPFNIGQEYVNDGLSSETRDDVLLPNDGNVYDMGYYEAFSNTRVATYTPSGAFVGTVNVRLPFTVNQHSLLTVY